MGLPVTKSRYSIEEYLLHEAHTPTKSEFHNGEILAMAGGTYAHNSIVENLFFQLRLRLRGHRCRAHSSEVRVRVDSENTYLYPDCVIVCEAPKFDSNDPNQTTIINPTAVFEVLSDSTQLYDRGAKFDLYREIGSLQEYVLLSQHGAEVEAFLRQPDGTWSIAHFSSIEEDLMLRSVGVQIPLSEIYEGVKFSNPPLA